MSREAMKQALEALDAITDDVDGTGLNNFVSFDMSLEAITALRKALEQPADEIDWKDQYEKQKRRAEMWVAKYEKDIGPVEKAVPMQQPADEPVAYIKTMIDALYENGDPVSVEAAELMEKLYTRPQLAAQLPEHIEDQVMHERDEYHEMADALAAKIEEITGTHIGEHSSANCPWRNALDAADDWIASPQPAAQWVEVECPLCGDMAVAHTHSVLKKSAAQWVGLTDDEVVSLKMLGRDLEFVSMTALRRFARDIEQTLKDKNT